MKVLKRILSITVVLVLVGMFTYKVGYIVRPTGSDGAYTQIETFHSLPDNSVEVMAYGSSHAFKGLNIMELYDKYGIGAYNYGWNWQACNTTNLFLKDSLDTQTPKVVLIETYLLAKVITNSNMDAQIYYSRYIHNEEAKKKYIQQCFGDDIERYISYYVPLCAFHDNWNTLSTQSFRKLSADNHLKKTMGFSPSDSVAEVEIPDYKTFTPYEFDEVAINEMIDMVTNCHNKGIDVIFYTVPWQGEYVYGAAMKEFAKENDCVYIDFFELTEEVGLDGKTDFSDVDHLNTSGATKIAGYLGKFIVDNYDVTDFRKVENNLWEKAKKL